MLQVCWLLPVKNLFRSFCIRIRMHKIRWSTQLYWASEGVRLLAWTRRTSAVWVMRTGLIKSDGVVVQHE